jgi:hypothetical protein
MKFAQQPRCDVGQTIRIGLAWMTTNKENRLAQRFDRRLQKLSRFHS